MNARCGRPVITQYMKKDRPTYLPEDTFCTEYRDGPTPNGGAYSSATYFDAYGRTCAKKDAYAVAITEYDESGARVNGTYGILKHSVPSRK